MKTLVAKLSVTIALGAIVLFVTGFQAADAVQPYNACTPGINCPSQSPPPTKAPTPTPAPTSAPNLQQLTTIITSSEPGSSVLAVTSSGSYVLAVVQHGDTGSEELWQYSGGSWLAKLRVGGAFAAVDLVNLGVPQATAQELMSQDRK